MLLTCLISALAVCSVASAQSISVGNGKLIYQVMFSSWSNPAAKLYTGDNCGTFGLVVAEKCDTRFVGYVDVLRDNDTRTTSEYTWPGSKKEDKWPQIGGDKYTVKTIKDFAYLNLTGVEPDGLREGILRVKVQDANLFNYGEINSYIGRLPGLNDLIVTRYESDSKFSEPIELDALSTVLPDARDVKKYKPDRATVQQQHLFVKVRAWGQDLSSRNNKNRASSADEGSIVQSDVSTSDSVDTDVLPKPKHHRHHHHHKHVSSSTEDTLSGSVETPSGGAGGSYLRNPSRDNYNRNRDSSSSRTSDTEKTD